jgi:hypothetical protein
VLAALGVALGVSGGAGAATGTSTTPTVTVAGHSPRPSVVIGVGNAAVGPQVPAGFVGLATTYFALEKLTGTNPKAIDPAFEQALSNLAPSGSLSLRIGGDSGDWTWWPMAGIKQPPWVRFNLSPAWARVVKNLATAVKAKLILGINLEGDNRRITEHELLELRSHIGLSRIRAFEVGNEPELYSKYPFYHDGTKAVRGRPATYQGAAIVSDWDRMVAGLSGGVPLAGPGFTSFNTLDDEAPLLRSTKRLSLLTVHSYPLKSLRCDGNRPLQESDLFQPTSLQTLAASAQTWARVAGRFGVPMRVDEMNSVTCGGLANYSDSLGPALWALNILPMYAQAGVSGVNFDTIPGSLQQLISAIHSSSGWSVEVQPEYYGLLAFAQLTPAGSRLLPISSLPTGMFAWADRTPEKETNMVVTNVTGTKQVVSLKATGVSGTATVTRLTAPGGLRATQGVTLGGQIILPGTGRLVGDSAATTISATDGHYIVTVPSGSAAIVSVS